MTALLHFGVPVSHANKPTCTLPGTGKPKWNAAIIYIDCTYLRSEVSVIVENCTSALTQRTLILIQRL